MKWTLDSPLYLGLGLADQPAFDEDAAAVLRLSDDRALCEGGLDDVVRDRGLVAYTHPTKHSTRPSLSLSFSLSALTRNKAQLHQLRTPPETLRYVPQSIGIFDAVPFFVAVEVPAEHVAPGRGSCPGTPTSERHLTRTRV